jgi:hypothetical protein
MMSGVPLETCWPFKKRWNNKFYYKFASCWYFYWIIVSGHDQCWQNRQPPVTEWYGVVPVHDTRLQGAVRNGIRTTRIQECTLSGKCISDVITTQHSSVSTLLRKRHSSTAVMSTTNHANVVGTAAAYNSQLSICLIQYRPRRSKRSACEKQQNVIVYPVFRTCSS